MLPCWNCRQPATHTLTREGSITLNACDNCTRIDREEAEKRGWTITKDRRAVSAAILAAELNVPTIDVINAAEELASEAAKQGKSHMSVFRSVVYAGDVNLAPDAANTIRAYYTPVFPDQLRDLAAGPEWSGEIPSSSTVQAEVSLVEGGTVGDRHRGPWEGTFRDTSTGASVTWGDTEPFVTLVPVTHAEAAERAFYELLPLL